MTVVPLLPMTLGGTIRNRISDGRAIVAVTQPLKREGGSSCEGRATGTSRMAIFSMWLAWRALFLSRLDDEKCDEVWWRFPHSSFWQRTRLAWSRRMFNRVNAVETKAIPRDKLVSFVYRFWFESLTSVEGMWPHTHRALSGFLVMFNCITIFI